MPKAEALREAKVWLRELRLKDLLALAAEESNEVNQDQATKSRPPDERAAAANENDRPFEAPRFWAAFVLAGDPD